jgi:beta-galactosidase/beta-glucuronidase
MIPRLLMLFTAASLASVSPARATTPEVRLLVPRDGTTLTTNTPTLAWSAGPAERLEVWIDGIRQAELAGDRTTYVPFPVSYGEHHWEVTAINGGIRTRSAAARFTVDDAPLARLPENAVLLRHDWFVQSSVTAGTDGALLSSPGVDVQGWARTSLPATVLTALVRNGVYPNPYDGLNNTRIPDAHDGYNADFDLLRFSHLPGRNPWNHPYWFRTEFSVPASYAGRRVTLTFNEINYRAEVWLNGQRVAGTGEMIGMDRVFRFDVTGQLQLDGKNVLAVAIHPLDHPGRPEPAPVTPLADPGRNMGADADISYNYTKWDVIGWDWQPEIRDRDIGITEDVFLSASGDVEIRDPYIATELALPDVSQAGLLLACDLVNAGAQPQRGTLRAVVADEHGVAARAEQSVVIAAGQTQRIEWTPRSMPAWSIAQPRLWWPAGLGEPHLYTLTLEYQGADGTTAKQAVPFGVRKLETYLSAVTKTRVFKVNGRDVYGQGGNWVIDMMLTWTASRYTQEIAAAREANLNFLRIWGPTGVPPESFFDAADRLGVMLQQDFLHDHWGTDQNKPGYAPPEDLYALATTAVIKKGRNHPSLFLWCGGNEGPNPHEQLITGKLLPALDPWGTRYYLSASLADGLQGGGPYHNLPAREYFNHPKIAGFNSEIGPSGLPEWESLREFLPVPSKEWAPNRFPLDGTWAYHDATDRIGGEGEHRKFSLLDNLIRQRYGAPATTDVAGMRDYAAKAQLLNYETYRAAMEALNQHLWQRSTGFAVWKYNSSWPSVLWQLTDWYQRLHAGSYSFRRALEPVHVQLNLDDRSVTVANRTAEARPGLVLEAELFDLTLQSLWKQSAPVQAQAVGATATGVTVPPHAGLTFLKLKLRSADGALVSDNFYWLEPTDNFQALAALPAAQVSLRATAAPGGAKVTLTNAGKVPALLVRVRLIDAPSGVEQLPTHWSDNYLNLLPGERVELTATSTGSPMPVPAIEVSGFNVPVAVTGL